MQLPNTYATLIDQLLQRFGKHFILLMMLATRVFGTTGGLLVIYYVEFTMEMPSEMRVHFRIVSLVTVAVACFLTVTLALWETRRLRPVLQLLATGRSVPRDLGLRAGAEAVEFAGAHHRHEAWLVPASTLIPVLVYLRVVNYASSSILINVTLAGFMAISLALMSHFFVIEFCMRRVIRLLLTAGIAIDYDAMRPAKLRFRMRLCFTLIIATTALMIGTVASQRADQMMSQPEKQEQAIQALRSHSVYITLFALVLGVIYSTIVADSVAQRVATLAHAMDRVGQGDLSERVIPTGKDEIDSLTRRFNIMVEQLAAKNRTIRDLNDNLEKKVARRTAELEETVAKLQKTQSQLKAYNEQLKEARELAENANRAKSDFLSNISHELRTPLNGVIGMNQLLLSSNLTDQQRKYAERARSSGEFLLQLVSDVLDFAKIEAGKLDMENIEFDLIETVESVIHTVAHRCNAKVELICDLDSNIPMLLRGDPGKLRQILLNLTNNALKFTKEGEVVVRARCGRRHAHSMMIEFEVADTGIGIDESLHDHLFEAFTQADSSTTREYGGTGLGLGICKRLCEMAGGEISFSSQLGKGSTFRFTIRVGTTKQKEPPLPDLAGVNVLVVEENATALEVLRRQLSAWKMCVSTETDANLAMQTLCTAAVCGQPFELALVNRKGAVADELAQTVMEEPTVFQTRIIAMAPLADRLDLGDMRRMGYCNWITKPIMHRELLQALLTTLHPEAVAKEPPAPPAPAPKSSDETPSDSCRILLVEDQEINREVVVEMLRQAGYRCNFVENGRQAVEEVQRTQYELILMDCLMPEMDGFEATRRIRDLEAKGGLPGRQKTPIVALTANAIKGDRERCLKAGMVDYLSKPVQCEKLIEIVRKYASATKSNATDVGNPASKRIENRAALENTTQHLDEGALDARKLLANCSENRELARRMVSKFIARVPQDLQTLRKLSVDQDAEQIGRMAHGLKGVAGSMAASRLATIAAELEKHGQQGRLEFCLSCIQRLEEEWRGLHPILVSLELD